MHLNLPRTPFAKLGPRARAVTSRTTPLQHRQIDSVLLAQFARLDQCELVAVSGHKILFVPYVAWALRIKIRQGKYHALLLVNVLLVLTNQKPHQHRVTECAQVAMAILNSSLMSRKPIV